MRNSDDAWLMCEILPKCNCVHLSSKGAYLYHIRNDSLSHPVGQEQINTHTTNNMSVLLKKLQNAFALNLPDEVKLRVYAFSLTSLADAVLHNNYPEELSKNIARQLESFRFGFFEILKGSVPLKTKIKTLLSKSLGAYCYLRILGLFHCC